MISFKDAAEKTMNFRGEIVDHCIEYDIAYLFTYPKDPISIGGFSAPIAVMKETGKIISQALLLLDYELTKIGEFDIKVNINKVNR